MTFRLRGFANRLNELRISAELAQLKQQTALASVSLITWELIAGSFIQQIQNGSIMRALSLNGLEKSYHA
jgi:hypothetical protein